ncbi:PLDc N-terminal domain-containing protein [Pseudomonas turukhanskensis]|uniref:Cardiolipin synthase N-terminal domain-containing protein n=1 Tax=Pseudomonas turukhanskensis TaxID=1806536 RepID=A0A9W6K8R8_9PSED|nr:PLDc N-terminal domain-containing protein [Pseudomonas turukhanskensis]GLK89554.1 hypothetical protein GCM10017655_26160 [Pseudomonas turukhanskensis]
MFLNLDFEAYRYWCYAALALLVLCHLWAAYQVVGSSIRRQMKVLWLTFLLFFPLLGFFNWYVMGPRRQLS